MSKEIWKPVKGFENYEISNKGRIARRNILRPGQHTHGYPYVILSKNGKLIHKYVHALLMATFKGAPPEGKPYILHADDNPENLCLSNLRYGSQRENVADAVKNKKFNNKKVSVQQFSIKGEFVKEYSSIYMASKEAGIPYDTFYAIATRGGRANGYIWKRA